MSTTATTTQMTKVKAAAAKGLGGLAPAVNSARVLDLNAIGQRFGGEPEYHRKPLFRHAVLNRAIIVKHSPQVGDDSRMNIGAPFATKVIFPFDHGDLSLGAQVVFVEQYDFVEALCSYLDYDSDADLERDVEVLRILARLPTLDPFLLRETIAQRSFDVAPCYYRLSDADAAEMLGFVAGEVESLIALCFGGASGKGAHSARMSEILLSDQGSDELDPLRRALRMEPQEFSEAVFAWKGFLYYRWRSGQLGPGVRAAKRSIGRISARHYDADWAPFVTAAKTLIERKIATAWREVEHLLRRYDKAYSALSSQNPEAFRAFLIEGPRLFVELGERIGRLDQIAAFTASRFDAVARTPETVWDGLRELLREISPPPADSEAGPRRKARAAADLAIAV